MTAAAQLLALLKLGAAELVRALLARLLPRALLGTSTARAARKASFIARANNRYGYGSSRLGHIDDLTVRVEQAYGTHRKLGQ